MRLLFRLAGGLLLLISVLFVNAALAQQATSISPRRILLVGNSLVYTNNLPAVLTALVEQQHTGAHVSVDMFAKGGARLSELYGRERLRLALRNGHYNDVILQERGGDAMCAADEDRMNALHCPSMIQAVSWLADLARHDGAKVYYLGTPQGAEASHPLVLGETWISKHIGAQYIEFSDTWQPLRLELPDYSWLKDYHPGHAMTALMAILTYRALYGDYPKPVDICTAADLYTPHTKINGFLSAAELMASSGADTCVMSKASMTKLIELLKQHGT